MSLAQALSTYVTANALIALAFVSLLAYSKILSALNLRIKARHELTLQYVMLTLVIAITVIHPFLPANSVFNPAAKVWSAQSIKNFSEDYKTVDQGGYLTVPTPAGTKTLQATSVSQTWLVLACILFFLGGGFLLRDLLQLIRIRKKSILIKRLGRVAIFVSETIQVPFSYWLPFEANVVVPTALLSKHGDYQIAVAHELQHHRQRDTLWVYPVFTLRVMCILNPFVHMWSAWISEIQEFACDETLVDQNKVESQAYARCLVEVAKNAIREEHVPVCATGLTFLIGRKTLSRRISRMFKPNSHHAHRALSVVVGIAVAISMAATAYASKSLVQDRRVTLAQAQAMANRAQSSDGFPVVINDLVLKQLNRYIGTPEGRDFMRASLQRMETFKPAIKEALVKYRAPEELLAIPIIESGYQNLTEGQSGTSMHAAGLWQFIPSTARNFGLKVTDTVDERLDVTLATDAAIRYLSANQLRFNDWALATLAYNMGERAVDKAIAETGSRDVWTLIRSGYEGDKDYVARLMAAILIMRNPESVQ
jgi:membrane-bound lytic murein transglycosylase D